jgi:hypothetical protein
VVLMLEHLHGHIEEVVELAVHVGRRVAQQVRHVGHGLVELLGHALARLLERLRDLPEDPDQLVLGFVVLEAI